MPNPPTSYLEITDRQGQTSRVPLSETGASAVIGRAETSHIRIAHDTVSKRHAELFRDPFGRWWLRDLGSRSGIRVNGQRIPEVVLGPSVQVRIGDFYLRLVQTPTRGSTMLSSAGSGATNVRIEVQVGAGAIDPRQPPQPGSPPVPGPRAGASLSITTGVPTPGSATGPARFPIPGFISPPSPPAAFPAARRPASFMHATLVEDPLGRLSTLSESPAPRLSAAQLAHVLELGRRLLETSDAQQRRQLLCDAVVHVSFRARTSMLLRVTPPPESDAAVSGAAKPTAPAGRAGTALPADASGVLTGIAPPELLAKADALPGVPGGRPPSARPGSAPGTAAPPQHVSRTVLSRVISSNQPVLASNAPVGPVDTKLTLMAGRDQMAVAACPLGKPEANEDGVVTIDVLYVVLPPECGTAEWLALLALCGGQYQQGESVWRERERAVTNALIDQELARAQEIQKRLVPQPADHPALDIGIGFRPCRWVGGDYLDVVHVTGADSTLLVIADVCGKGLQAALVAGIMHSIVNTRARGTAPAALPELADDLNRYFMNNLSGLSWATFAALRICHTTGAIECVNAGHLPPLIVGATGKLRRFGAGVHMPLGLDEQTWESEQDTLAPGEWLALATDGVTETSRLDGSMLGMAGWETCLLESLGKTNNNGGSATSDGVARQIEVSLDEINPTTTPQDDRTFLVVRRR